MTEPYAHGLLDVGDGHRVYWEECGNPAGRPAVVLHGGPGTGCTAAHRDLFDPELYRVVLLDQRGCGRSTPRVLDHHADLSANHTSALVGDLERLREHRGVDRWLVLGGSWGSTLGLAYAQAHPDRVTAMVLTSVALLRPAEAEWLYGGGAGRFFPEAWAAFSAPAAGGGAAAVFAAYHRLLHHPDPAVRDTAVAAWCAWEAATLSLHPDPHTAAAFADPRFAATLVRLALHYFRHDGWLEDDQLLRDAGRLRGIPGVLVAGRGDVQTPVRTAWELAQAWPDARLVVVDGGHASTAGSVAEALRAATTTLAG
ncbi:prolyl aminopeptidase [Jiangella sp. DSM 45060]|uniref:prolyl aminopeptidase n=1 Tax=Jiangella sp. DSM 45060 TaxID=1798224 RepID=UPI00087B26F5|nr:prolyl aminopeptidase [Jiangella sp. DSM 45060]SDS11381.1 prolyl aminopeptidase Serine peptidase. MEROPS family S33 [Jiangella sp. DSM 45060]